MNMQIKKNNNKGAEEMKEEVLQSVEKGDEQLGTSFLEGTAGDEVYGCLKTQDMSDICTEEAPYIDFVSEFLNDPLELIKLYEFIGSVENQGDSFYLGNEVVNTSEENYELMNAYIGRRFEPIMPGLEKEINKQLQSDDLEWVWNRDKWESYKKNWYNAHGIHEYGKTPYCC